MNRFDTNEAKIVETVIKSGELSRFFVDFRGGKFVQQFEREFAEYLGVKHAVSCCNGTVSLELALQAMGVGKGDEVITTPLSFIATATAILRVGARPVFVDVDENLCLDPIQVQEAITGDTKAIIPVSLNGYPCNMNAITEVAEDSGVAVLEDAAQALGAKLNGKEIGSFGTCASFSFQESKTITTLGEGGMVTTDDDGIAESLRNIRNHGNLYGTMDESVCTNARMTEAQAAFGIIQLKKLDTFNEIHAENAEFFLKYLPEGFKSVWKYPLSASIKPNYYLIPVIYQPDGKMPFDKMSFIQYAKDCGLSKGVPGDNVGYYKRLIYDNAIFAPYRPLAKQPSRFSVSFSRNNSRQCPTAEKMQESVILFDIHRWTKTQGDMKTALEKIRAFREVKKND